MSHRATAFIVDDDKAVLDSLQSLFSTQDVYSETFSSAKEFLTQVLPDRPGCVVLDLYMPGIDGMELLKKLACQTPRRPAIVITGNGEVPSAVQAMKLGAIDVLEKPFNPSKLVEQVQWALKEDLLARTREKDLQATRSLLSQLTPAEREIALHLRLGLTNAEIAKELDISLRTVQLRRSSLFKKIGVRTRREMLQLLKAADVDA